MTDVFSAFQPRLNQALLRLHRARRQRGEPGRAHQEADAEDTQQVEERVVHQSYAQEKSCSNQQRNQSQLHRRYQASRCKLRSARSRPTREVRKHVQLMKTFENLFFIANNNEVG